MKTSSWQPLICDYEASKNIPIKNIINGENPALILKNFYDKKSCNIASSNVKNYSTHSHEEGVIKKIGIFLSAYLQRPDEYFDLVQSEQKNVNAIFNSLEDPIEKIKSLLSESLRLKVEIANQNNMLYSAGVIRIHEVGDYAPIHRDNANFEARNFTVSKYDSQISCVLHLKAAKAGGEIKIYKQFWEKRDEKFRNPGFGYSNNVLSTKENVIVKPEVGDLIIINPLYYHEILPVKESNRISLGSFLGFSKNLSSAIMWA